MASAIDYANPGVLKVARTKCLESIEFFTRYFFMSQYKRKFILSEHHRKICAKLEEVYAGKCKRLIINMPPRYGKTELAVKSFIANGLALNPAAKFIHLSYGDAIALDNSEAIKDLIESKEYQDLFPGIQIKRDSKAKEKWYTNQGGGILARAAGGQVTGFGAGHVDEEGFGSFIEALEDNQIEDLIGKPGASQLELKLKFAGAIVIDDPIKPEDADQDTKRKKVNERFDSTIRNRANSRNTPIVIIMHRLHPEDLAGYLLRDDEADEWEVLSLPALVEDEDSGEEVILKDGTKKYYKALWPHKHTVQELLSLQQANDLVFGRQYQQDPSPKHGLLFPLSDLRKYDPSAVSFEDPDFALLCGDPANEGGDDFAAGIFKLIGKDIYLTDIIYNTNGTDHNEPAIESLVMNKEHKIKDVAIEGIMGWKETATRIRDRITNIHKYGDKTYSGDFRIVRPRTNKHSRILNRSAFIKNNILFREDWAKYPQYEKFMRNLISYLRIQEAGSGNKHDDAPDLCEMAAAYYEKNFAHLW